MRRVMRRPCPECGAVLFTGVDAWYRAYAPRLRHLVGRFTTDRGVPRAALDPEDVVHDVFELLQVRLDRHNVRQPAGWLRKVAERHVARAHGEMRRVAGGDLDDDLIASQVKVRWSSHARTADLDTVVEYRAALAAIAALPDRQRAAVYLQRIEGMSHGEIAERLGIAAATVSVHAHRGIRSVREALGDELDDAERTMRVFELSNCAGRPLMPLRFTEWAWCPCWRSLPIEYDHTDELLSLVSVELTWTSDGCDHAPIEAVRLPQTPPATD
jgi:RNA polymerase sigma factor (sigma-70 family)